MTECFPGIIGDEPFLALLWRPHVPGRSSGYGEKRQQIPPRSSTSSCGRCTASIRTRGGSARNSRGGSPEFNAAPEIFLGRDQQVLVERISRNGNLGPLATAGDNGQRCSRCIGHPHVVLNLCHASFGRASSENDHGSTAPRIAGPRSFLQTWRTRPLPRHPTKACTHRAQARA